VSGGIRPLHIHPFLDGNGRTARLLSTLCLYQRGYDFKKLFTISEYYDRNRTRSFGKAISLSDRQKLAIEYIVKHGGITIQQFEAICPDVTRRTLQRELKELINKNILYTSGATQVI
jgi:Fic family protein